MDLNWLAPTNSSTFFTTQSFNNRHGKLVFSYSKLKCFWSVPIIQLKCELEVNIARQRRFYQNLWFIFLFFSLFS